MEQYPLQGLLNLRELRQSNAQRATAAQRKVVAAAEAAIVQAEAELEEFKVETEKKIEAIYAGIMDQVLSQKELSDVFARINGMYAQIEQKKLHIEQLKEKLEEENRLLEQLREEERQRSLALARLGRHKEIWDEKAKAEEEYKADQALEDFIPRKLDFFDENENNEDDDDQD